MIKSHSSDFAGQTAAFATPVPRNIAFTGGKFVVHTGVDYAAEPAPTKDEQDTTDALSRVKLKEMMAKTPDEMQAWVAGSVKDTAALQDVVATLAIAVGILARRL